MKIDNRKDKKRIYRRVSVLFILAQAVSQWLTQSFIFGSLIYYDYGDIDRYQKRVMMALVVIFIDLLISVFLLRRGATYFEVFFWLELLVVVLSVFGVGSFSLPQERAEELHALRLWAFIGESAWVLVKIILFSLYRKVPKKG